MDAVMKVMEAWVFLLCPLVLSEDATAQHCRADVMSVHKDTLIFGFNGPTLVVNTAEELQKLQKDKNASYATLRIHLGTIGPRSPLLSFVCIQP